MTMVLPEGVTASVHAEAVDAFTKLLGADDVLTDDVTGFRDPYEFQDWELYLPSAVLLPTTVEEVQEIVRIATEHGIPLWTHGQGRNNGYGGAAPRVKGAWSSACAA